MSCGQNMAYFPHKFGDGPLPFSQGFNLMHPVWWWRRWRRWRRRRRWWWYWYYYYFLIIINIVIFIIVSLWTVLYEFCDHPWVESHSWWDKHGLPPGTAWTSWSSGARWTPLRPQKPWSCRLPVSRGSKVWEEFGERDHNVQRDQRCTCL